MFKSGDVILAQVQFTDSPEVKVRPAVVLFEELGNIVVSGITSNTEMRGIPLTRKEGAIRDSVIKVNYIFTLSSDAIYKVLFHLSAEKKRAVFAELIKRLSKLNERVLR